MKKSFKTCHWITASAGTGKTTMIDSLIQELLEKKIYPGSIICLTFTRNAAFEMADRYARGDHKHDTMPRFETIHSFAKSLIPEKYRVITGDKSDDLIQEAIEVVLSSSECHPLIDATWEGWSSIINDLKTMVLNTKEGEVSYLEKFLSKNNQHHEITLSNETVELLHKQRHGPLVSQILSNNISTYRRLITKELKIHSKYLPENLLSVEDFPEAVAELNQVFKQILNLVTQSVYTKNLQQSIYVNQFINEVKKIYKDIKEARKMMDFSDIITFARRNLGMYPEKIRGIRHLFVDEAQDMNQSQWEFIQEMAGDILQTPDSSITIVGDEKQIIYEFNGASSELYSQAKSYFQKTIEYLGGRWKETNLTNNYRSSEILLQFISSIYQNVNVNPKGPKHGYIKTWSPIKDTEEINSSSEWKIPGAQIIPGWIHLCVAEINNLLKKNFLLNKQRLIQPSDIMILVPRRCISIFLLIEELKKSKIPISNSPFHIITDETIQEILGVAEVVLDPSNDVMVAGILKGAYFRWSNEDLEKILVNRDNTVLQYMIGSNNPKVSHAAKVIQSWFEMPKDLYGFYSKLLFHTDYGHTLWQTFPNETLLFWERVVYHKSISLAEFIHCIKNSTHTLVANINGVNVSTIHSAKGRESEIVFLCNSHTCQTRYYSSNIISNNLLLLKGNYPMYKNAKHKFLADQDEESMRLFYVALTRAKEQLYILPPLSSETINAKSWYSLVMQNLVGFTESDGCYDSGTRPGLTKRLKYS